MPLKLKQLRSENLMLLIALGLSLLGLVVFLALIPVHEWLWAGWLFGSASIFIGHGIGILLLKLFFKKRRSWLGGFFSGIGTTMVNYVFQVGMFFVVIAIDTSYHHAPFMNSGVAVLAAGPIVFYTYLGGISVMALAVISMLFIRRKKKV